MLNDVTSHIYYLERDERFKTEKPFSWSAELACLPGLPKSNHIFTSQEVKVHDVRGREDPSLSTHGFEFASFTTSMTAEDFEDENLIESKFYAEVEAFLWRHLRDVTGIAILGHQVRKRSEKFPRQEGALVKTGQPQTMAHADLTVQGAKNRLKLYFQDNPELERRPWEMINLWRVLKGPNNDWPLALCDYRSVDLDRDTVANDIVVAHGDGSVENSLLQHNEKHKWFYKSDMDAGDVILFRQVDSTGKLPRAWHASFDHVSSNTGPRESIDVRLAVWK